MAAYKLSIIMKYLGGNVDGLSENRTGGWSEGVYWSTWGEDVRRSFLRLINARAALLPTFSAVTGYRVQQVDPAGPASSVKLFRPGPNLEAWASDIPQMGVLFSCTGQGVTNVLRHRMAGIPDPQMTRGEFRPTPAYTDTFSRYLAELRGWLFRGADLTKPLLDVKTIDALGNVEMLQDLLVLPGNFVTVRKALDTNNRFVTKTFRVGQVTDSKHFKLDNWTAGACTKGRARQFVPIYPVIVIPSPTQPTAIVRKIGRPSNPYVGRRSRRRS